MREDAYTSSKIDDDYLSLIEDTIVDEFDADLEEDVLAYIVDDENKMIIHVGGAADGSKSLREAAELLYEFADELLSLSGEGWEIVDGIKDGCGTAVRFDADELAELESTDG